MNWLEWYRIVAYRDFGAAPRVVLATNDAEDAFWLLDAGVDAPTSIYTIHDAGHTLDEATRCFERHASDTNTLDMIGCIPVEHVQFDAQKRLKLTSPVIE